MIALTILGAFSPGLTPCQGLWENCGCIFMIWDTTNKDILTCLRFSIKAVVNLLSVWQLLFWNNLKVRYSEEFHNIIGNEFSTDARVLQTVKKEEGKEEK